MPVYPSRVNDRSHSAERVGIVGDANVSATAASFVCGSFTTFSLRIDEIGVIEAAGLLTNGCGFMVASADVVCEWLNGRAVTDLHGLSDPELLEIVRGALGEFPAHRTQCASIVFEALRKAMAEYRERRVKEFCGEVALICTCFGVSEDTIMAIIASNDVSEVDEVSAMCRAGSGCGSCRMLIRELIDSK